MIKVLLLLLMIVLFVFQSTALKKIEVDSIRQNLLVTGISSGMIAAALAVWAAVTGLTFSTVTLLCGLVFGIGLVVSLVAVVTHLVVVEFDLQFVRTEQRDVPNAVGTARVDHLTQCFGGTRVKHTSVTEVHEIAFVIVVGRQGIPPVDQP